MWAREQTFLEASSTSIILGKSIQNYFHNQGNDDKKKWQPLNLKQKQCLWNKSLKNSNRYLKKNNAILG